MKKRGVPKGILLRRRLQMRKWMSSYYDGRHPEREEDVEVFVTCVIGNIWAHGFIVFLST